MGTTAEKGARVLQSIAEVQEGINNLGGSLTDQTPFKDFKAQLDEIYNNLPKTEYQEGTEVTLSNTLKGKLDYEDNKVGCGDTEQESTQGYNLTKVTSLQQTSSIVSVIDEKIILNGTSSGVNVLVNLNDVTLEAGTYYCYVKRQTTKRVDISLRTTNNVEIVALGNNFQNLLTNRAFVLSNDTLMHSINLWLPSDTYDDTLEIMICKATHTADEYEQYTGGQASPSPNWKQAINSVTGNQDVVVRGKNLANCNGMNNTLTNGIDYVISKNNNGSVTEITANGICVNYSALLSSGIYKLKAGSYKLVGNGITNSIVMQILNETQSSQLGYAGASNTTLILNEDTNVVIRYYVSVGYTANNVKLYPMIVETSVTDLTYEPYITPTSYQLSLGEYKFNGIGNYKDELIYDVDEDKVYKNGYINEIGKDDVLQHLSSGYEEFTDVVRSVINLGDLPSSISSANGLCSHLVFLADFTRNIEHFYVQNTQIFIFIKKSRLSEISRTGIYNYLATLTDLKFCYAMNTRVETEITDTTLKAQVKAWYNAHSNNGTTIITSNGDLPMIIKVRGLKGE